MQPSAAQPVEQPGIDSAERQMSLVGELARAGHVVEQPTHLGGGEIGVQHQAGALPDVRLVALRAQRLDQRRGAAALPDDGRGDRLAAAAVPDEGGFALIGDAEGGDLGGGHAGLSQNLPRRAELRLPQRRRVLLHPARLRKVRGQRLLRLVHDVAAVVEQQGAGAAGSLVEGQYVSFRHVLSRQDARAKTRMLMDGSVR